MQFKDHFPFTNRLSVFFKQPKFFPNTYDFIALLYIVTLLALIAVGVRGTDQSLDKLASVPITLSLENLPKYALFTTLRMFAAIFCSLFFTFTVATVAAKSRKAEMIIIPMLDVLQSVPVLGFLTFTVAFFMQIFPGQEYGVELAAIFAVFSAQAWNMAFSFYQSLRTLPQDLQDVSEQFRQNGWQKFWRLEVPFAMPGLVWNTMMSMSGSWFFIVASEAISIGNTRITLPGIGSWLGLAISNKDLTAVGWAILAMALIILAYDQVIFRPIVAWSDKFNMGQTSNQNVAKSWLYEVIKQTRLLGIIFYPLRVLGKKILSIRLPKKNKIIHKQMHLSNKIDKFLNILWFVTLGIFVAASVFFLVHYLYKTVSFGGLVAVFVLGLITMLRVVVLVFLASLIWVPIGVWVGLRPNLVSYLQPAAQFLAAFPANILFPFFVVVIVKYDLDPDVWLSPLMILGTQWYIFFNVVAGMSAFPNDLKEAASVYQVRSWTWWRRVILPGIFPYYVTGALTASGGCWNASIIAEVVSWGNTQIEAHGLGAYIAAATSAGNYHKVVLGVAVMSVLVILLNRIFWRRVYTYAARFTGIE